MHLNTSSETAVGDEESHGNETDSEERDPEHETETSANQHGPSNLDRGQTSLSVTRWAKKRLEEHENLPSQSVSWWHPHLAKLRKHTSILWMRNTFIICVSMFAILCLYWGIVYRIEENLPSLVCYVVDFDGVAPYGHVPPLIGPAVTNLANETLRGAIPSIGFQVRAASEFDYDPMQVREAVYHFRAWSAVIVNSNATALLQNAVTTGNASYDPTGAVQVITMSGRDSFMTYSYILPKLNTFTQELTSRFGRTWGDMILANDSLARDTLRQAASAVNPAIAPLSIDLRPFGPPAAIPAATFGLSFLIAHLGFTYYLADDAKCIIPEGHPPVHYWHHIIRRWFALMAAYVLLALVYCLISLAFQVPLSNPPAPPTEVAWNPNAFGRASFFVLWMLHFLGMAALGMACENMAMIIGPRWVGLWLTFWTLTNTLTGFWPPDIAPGFYRWAYAWPYHHVVEGSRQIMFDLHSRIGLNFGVLAAWVCVNTAVFVPACYILRWKDEKEQRKEETRLGHFSLKRFDVEKQIPKPPGAKPPRRKRGFLRAM
ncbi:Nitrosoguanidine resistance protein SNG1 [Colletotrichum spinosum]|uniref:Nitrosoguanidine resistance protein SNG1 n=1 Tax=Colletotrichum spinosum TaxID=1347390 RepID=A0A4R8PMF1_9PEZI|nr:Nitrosoguanidine resistance protein SNG1 [Colletotrichum spinosum]